MADEADYSAALEALLAALRAPDSDDLNVPWLADSIERELDLAETEARDARMAANADVDTQSDAVLSAHDRLEIAVGVMYHHLVSVPRMLAHVQAFWRTRAQAHVIVIDPARERPVDLGEHAALHTADTAEILIRRLVGTLSQQYGLTLSVHGLSAAQDHDHG